MRRDAIFEPLFQEVTFAPHLTDQRWLLRIVRPRTTERDDFDAYGLDALTFVVE